eukprot:UN1155
MSGRTPSPSAQSACGSPSTASRSTIRRRGPTQSRTLQSLTPRPPSARRAVPRSGSTATTTVTSTPRSLRAWSISRPSMPWRSRRCGPRSSSSELQQVSHMGREGTCLHDQ